MVTLVAGESNLFLVLDAYLQLIFVTPSTLILYKKIINCKKMLGWYAEKYANKVGMMHESKLGQHIGNASSLHLFHTTFRQHP